MAIRLEPGETMKIIYTARRSQTGLTDCKATIWDPSNTKLVDSVAMTELSNGIYIYSYPLADNATSGVYSWLCNSASAENPDTGSFIVGSVWDTKLSEHISTGTVGKKVNDIRRTGGVGYAASTESPWRVKDINKLFSELDITKKTLDASSKSTKKEIEPLMRLFKGIIESIVEIRKDLKILKKGNIKISQIQDQISSYQESFKLKLDELSEFTAESADIEALEKYDTTKNNSI